MLLISSVSSFLKLNQISIIRFDYVVQYKLCIQPAPSTLDCKFKFFEIIKI